MNGHPTHLDPLRPSAPEPLALARPQISRIENLGSPNITGYPLDAGTNAGQQKLRIIGSGFGRRVEQISVCFEPKDPRAETIQAKVLNAIDSMICVRTPPTKPHGAVGVYNVKVVVANQVAQGDVLFAFLTTFVVSQNASKGFQPGAVNAGLTEKITFLSKPGERQIQLYFWERQDNCWKSTKVVGQLPHRSFHRKLTLQLTAPRAVLVAITHQPKAPEPDASGSNGTINVGSGQGEEPGVP